MKTKKKILRVRTFVIIVMVFLMIAALSLAKSDTKAYAEHPPAPSDPIRIIGRFDTIGSVSKKQIVVKLSEFEEDEYVVAYKTAGAKKWKYKNATGDYTITGLKPNSMVQIKAAVRRDDVTGEWSDVVCRYMSTVKRCKAKAGKKCITVTWKKDTKATGYQIFYSTNKNMKGYKKITVKGANKTKRVIKGLKKGKTYYVRVRPIKKYKGKTYVGILAPIRTIKVH